MNRLSDNFIFAATDYRYLLERHYPQKTLLKMVGNRYALNGTERTMLYRGITTTNEACTRKQKKTSLQNISSEKLFIDGFNVLITIGNYLLGKTVYISTDSFLRDAAEMDGKSLTPEKANRSLTLMYAYLHSIKVKFVTIYLDISLDRDHHFNEHIRETLTKDEVPSLVEVVDSADEYLIDKQNGLCATSDSLIIDKSKCPIVDLACETINYHFHPVFTDLNDYIS